MCKRELTEFLAELTEFAAELSEFSSPKQYSRNSIPPVPHLRLGRFRETYLTYGEVFLPTVGLCCLLSIHLIYLLTVVIWFGLFIYGGISVWSFLLLVGFGLFCLRFLHRN